MAAIDPPSGKLDIGDVIAQTFKTIGRNFVPFLILAVVLVGIPNLAFGVVGMQLADGNFSANTIAWTISGGLIAAVAALVLQGAIIHGTISDMNGRKASVADGLATGLRSFFVLFLVSLLYGLAVGFGMLLLIVPGIMIAVAWCVCVPVLIAERPDILMESFSRSSVLTRGNRWRIFGLFVVYVVVSAIIGMLVGLLGGAASLFNAQAIAATALTPLGLILNTVVNVLQALLGAVGSSVLYVDLRRLREGVGAESLASIFD